MAGFGGAVKLTGESEYRKALKNITQNLKEVASEMKLVSAQYGKNDTSTEALTAKSDVLSKKLEQQKSKVELLKKQYGEMSAQYDENARKNDALAKTYDDEKSKLSTLEKTLGTTSDEYKAQAEVVADLEAELEKSKKAQELNTKTMSDMRIQLNNAETDVAKTSNELENLSKQMDESASSSGDLGEALTDVGENADGATGGISTFQVALGNLVSNVIGSAISKMQDLVVESSNAYAQFSASTGTATDAMGEYQEAIDNVYKSNFGESLEDVADAMGRVKNATKEVDPSKLEEMTEKAMTLEDVFGMDLDETIRGVNSLMTHFGISSEEAFDLMAYGAQNGLNYTDELGDNIAEYAGKFAEAGYSTEEYFQLLQNGTEGGAYNLDKVNDAINEVTTRLGDGTIEKGIGSFSTKTQDLFTSWQNGGATQKEVIDSIVADIQNATGEQDKMNMSALAFGTMAEDGGTKFIQSLTSVGNTYDSVQGKADALANTKYDTPASAIQGLGRTIQTDLLQPLVNKLMPAINTVVDVATKGIQWISQNGTTLISVITGIATTVGTYVAYTTAMKVMKEGWQALTIVTKAQTLAQTALNAVMSANPIGVVIALIAGLVTAFVVLWNKSEAFRNFWIGLWDNIKSVAEPIINGLVEWFTTAWDAIKSVWDGVQPYFKFLWNLVKAIFSGTVKQFFFKEFLSAWNSIKQVFAPFGEFFKGLWNDVKNTFTSLGTKIGDAIGKAVKSGINGVISQIERVINSGIDLINGAIRLINLLPGVSVGSVGRVRFPRLARGGVVDSATFAEIGEAGAEAVVPLENNTGWITKIAQQLATELVPAIVNATKSVNMANYNNNSYNDTVEAFKDALGQMKITLDDETLGSFVEKTVADAIYT